MASVVVTSENDKVFIFVREVLGGLSCTRNVFSILLLVIPEHSEYIPLPGFTSVHVTSPPPQRMSPHPPLLSFGHHVHGEFPIQGGGREVPICSHQPAPTHCVLGPAIFSLHSHSFLLHVLTCVKYQITDNMGTRGFYPPLTAVLDRFPHSLRFQLIHNHCGLYFQFSASFRSQKSPFGLKA